MKQKLKTKRSIFKRYKKTKTGKFLRRQAYRGHILEKKSPNRKRHLRRRALLSAQDKKQIRLLLQL
nr:ribosomal protein L35 [Meringosphaera mediterranea]